MNEEEKQELETLRAEKLRREQVERARAALERGGVPQSFAPLLAVGEARCAGSTAVLPVTLAAVGLESSYTLTELGIYAEDPDEGEILYCVYRLDEPASILAGSDTVLRFYLRQTVSADGGAAVLCSPAGLITESDCGPVRKKVLLSARPAARSRCPWKNWRTTFPACPAC